jgi:hypothetical protein
MHDCHFPQKFMRIPLKTKIDSLAKSAHLVAKRIGTNPTHFFYAVESESDYQIYDTLSNYQSIVTVGDAVEGSILTIQAEILELDTIGFDETLPHEESLDI